MTVLIDTSVWVHVLRDGTGRTADRVRSLVGDEDVALTRFSQLELLQGAANEREWVTLATYLEGQDYLEVQTDTWRDAARIYYELRRQGRTIRSTIDCCVAQLALDHKALLIHDDRDFEAIAQVRPLETERIVSTPTSGSP